MVRVRFETLAATHIVDEHRVILTHRDGPLTQPEHPILHLERLQFLRRYACGSCGGGKPQTWDAHGRIFDPFSITPRLEFNGLKQRYVTHDQIPMVGLNQE